MGSVAAPVTIALADDTGTSASGTTTTSTSSTGSVTIAKNANNTSDTTTTIGYQIFKADVVDNGTSKTASNIAWASDEVATVVNAQITAFAKASGSTYTGTTAQEAADYLATHLPAEGSSGTSTIIESGKLYSNIANALRADTKLTPTTLTIGVAQDLSAGYWLFLTNSTSTNNGTNQVNWLKQRDTEARFLPNPWLRQRHHCRPMQPRLCRSCTIPPACRSRGTGGSAYCCRARRTPRWCP